MLTIHWHHGLFKILVEIVGVSCEYITFFGAFVLIGGTIVGAINICLAIFNTIFGIKMPMVLSEKRGPATFAGARLQVGIMTAIGLEILVVADVMETLTKLETEDYSWNALGKIGAVALFRTVLAYMLGREVKEVQEEIEAEEKGHKHSKGAKAKQAIHADKEE